MEIQRIKEVVMEEFAKELSFCKIKDVTVEKSLDIREKNKTGWKFILFEITIREQTKTITIMVSSGLDGYYQIFIDENLIGNLSKTNSMDEVLKTLINLLKFLL